MNFLEEWKLKRKYIKEGNLKEYQYYLNIKNIILNDIEMCKLNISKYLELLKKADKNSNDYSEYKKELDRWRYLLEKNALESKFIRPNEKGDIEYRDKICDYFSKEIKSLLEGDTTLRFHGTSIYYTKQILKSGTITSTSNRYEGYMNSTDLDNEFSVTDVSTTNRTLSFFTDLSAYQKCLPAGCLFILKSNNLEDNELIKYACMKSFDFRKSPERFVGICTTTENIPVVREWLKTYGYNENLVFTFDQFLEMLQTLSDNRKL